MKQKAPAYGDESFEKFLIFGGSSWYTSCLWLVELVQRIEKKSRCFTQVIFWKKSANRLSNFTWWNYFCILLPIFNLVFNLKTFSCSE